MARKGGNPNLGAGPGRPKGLQNKSTIMAKQAIAAFVEGNSDRLNGWLDEIESKHGAKAAFDAFKDMIEYHVPKLSRSEVSTTLEGSMGVGITGISIEHVKAESSDT